MPLLSFLVVWKKKIFDIKLTKKKFLIFGFEMFDTLLNTQYSILNTQQNVRNLYPHPFLQTSMSLL
jgi:hypothetical protein